jgi:hypothetical protein
MCRRHHSQNGLGARTHHYQMSRRRIPIHRMFHRSSRLTRTPCPIGLPMTPEADRQQAPACIVCHSFQKSSCTTLLDLLLSAHRRHTGLMADRFHFRLWGSRWSWFQAFQLDSEIRRTNAFQTGLWWDRHGYHRIARSAIEDIAPRGFQSATHQVSVIYQPDSPGGRRIAYDGSPLFRGQFRSKEDEIYLRESKQKWSNLLWRRRQHHCAQLRNRSMTFLRFLRTMSLF